MAEELSAAAGSVGTNLLQRETDVLTRNVETINKNVAAINDALSKAVKNLSGVGGSSNAGQGWNSRSNWRTNGGMNGGSTTFGGVFSGGRHTEGQPTPQQEAAAEPSHRASGRANMWSGASRTEKFAMAGVAAGLVGFGAHRMSMTGLQDGDTSTVMATAARMGGLGANVDLGKFYGRSNASMNGADQAAAYLFGAQNYGGAVGSSRFESGMSNARTAAIMNPTLSLAQAQAATNFGQTAQGYRSLGAVGVQTMRKGKPVSITEIANQVLKQTDPRSEITTDEAIKASIDNQNSPMRQTISAWVAEGRIPPEYADQIITSIRYVLKARQKGKSFRDVESTANALDKGKATGDQKDFAKSIGLGDSAMQSAKNKQAAETETTSQRLGGFETGLKGANEALDRFRSTLNDITGNAPLLERLLGGKKGFSSAGGSTLGKLLGGGPLALLGLFGGGGDYDGRMITTAGGGAGASNGSVSGSAFSSGSFGGGAFVRDDGVGGVKEANYNTATGNSGKGSKKKNSSGSQRLIRPVGGRITNPYGKANRRYASGAHTGVDFGVPTGTPIKAAAAGTVISAGGGGAYGNLTKINHGNGIQTWYAHQSRFKVRKGASVRQGQVIGYVGMTGNVTGPHLHLEVRINGAHTDPMKYISGGGSLSIDPAAGGEGTSGAASPGAENGTQNAATGSSGSGIAGASTSEAANVAAALAGGISGASGAPMGSSNTEAGTNDSAASSGSTVKNPDYGNVSGKGGSAAANKALMKQMAAAKGWGSGAQWSALVSLINGESGFRNTAQNPSSTAYGLFQFLNGTWAGTGYKKTSDPATQIKAGFKYIENRYGDPIKANAFKKRKNWYEDGAWEILQDEDARVHKGEMVVDAKKARQIREVMLHNNPYGAQGNGPRAGGSDGIQVTFEKGSFHVELSGSATTADGHRLATGFMETFDRDQRLNRLKTGATT